MKTKEEIVKNWLPRYTGESLENFGKVTSGMDSTHGLKSMHYKLAALDFRTKDFPSLAAKHLFRDKLAAELGPDYQVILESLGTDNEHCHAEHDPA